MFDFLRLAPALFWLPGPCPGVYVSSCGTYRVTADYWNPREVDVSKNGRWCREFGSVDAAKRWCAEDAA